MEKINGLTSLRAVAALWVAIGHFYYQVPIGGGFLESILRLGGLGVPLFFVLSGFILSHTYQNKFSEGLSFHAVTSYGISRFARVYPAHLVMLLLYAVILVPTGLYPRYFYDTAASLLASMALVHAWGFYPVPVWNQPSWTVSVELICYATFPLAAFWLASLSRSRSLAAAAAIAIVGELTILVFQTEWIFYFPLFILKYTAWFLLGCLIYAPFRDRVGRMGPMLTSCAVVGAMIGILASAYAGPRFEGLVPVCFAAWIFALASGSGPVRRLFEARAFVYAGEISYSYFLAHEAALLAMLEVAKPLGYQSADIPMVLKIISGLVFALPLYHFVEDPVRRLIKTYAKKRFAV